MENYRESYTYDDAGNLIKTTHTATNSWTRTQEIMPDSNRLKTVSSNNGFTDSLPITYDRSGNQQQLNGNSTVSLTFNCCENLVQARIIERPDLPDDSDYYTYDVDEMRTRKVSERLINGGAVIEKEAKIYIGNYEVKRLQRNESNFLKRQTLRVMDDETCVAIFHYWEEPTPNPSQEGNEEQVGTRKLRYQLDNHLGSVALEMDDDAQIISYEEYFPYGGTAFIAGKNQKEVKLKEYRYSGKERDDATGLYYYGARYYAPWLGRWLKPDPAGTVDGLNLYEFVGGNPVTLFDKTGEAANNNDRFQPIRERFQQEQNNENNQGYTILIRFFSRMDEIQSGSHRQNPNQVPNQAALQNGVVNDDQLLNNAVTHMYRGNQGNSPFTSFTASLDGILEATNPETLQVNPAALGVRGIVRGLNPQLHGQPQMAHISRPPASLIGIFRVPNQRLMRFDEQRVLDEAISQRDSENPEPEQPTPGGFYFQNEQEVTAYYPDHFPEEQLLAAFENPFFSGWLNDVPQQHQDQLRHQHQLAQVHQQLAQVH